MSEAKILENDPLSDADTILRDDFYGRTTHSKMSDKQAELRISSNSKQKEKPTHYKVVCISLYTQDIENLEATVAELKRRGHTKANKSQLIRQALRQLDIDKLPPPQQ